MLEDALIKITAVASRIDSVSVRDMIEALIAGQRNPRLLADLARGRMKLKHADRVEALTGQFDEHHAELARMLLDQIDALTAQIDTLTARNDGRLADLLVGPGPDADPPEPGPGGGSGRTEPPSAASSSAEGTAPASTAPRAAPAAKTQTFLGERYRRIVKRRGKLKALVAVARSILVIIWNLLARPGLRFHDLGVDYHTNRIDTERRTRNHVRQLEALGYTVSLTAAA